LLDLNIEGKEWKKTGGTLGGRMRTDENDEIGFEVLHGNKTAAAFWNSVGFGPVDRFLFRKKLG
jgi:hypothetical protein